MNISFHTIKSNIDKTRGYGTVGYNLIRSLQSLGYTVPFNDSNSNVQLSLNMPPFYQFHDHQFKIGYTPWESTALPPGWLDKMNQCDEVWATSDWVKQVYLDCGVEKPVFVYPHGIEKKWQPIQREVKDVVRFLHVGEPALRKGGQMAVDAFREAFGDSEDVHLTVKAYYQHHLLAWREDGHLDDMNKVYNNVTIIRENLTGPQMTQLYADHHIMIYPSYGEGFGFIPLQALATGMPVLTTGEWAPYRKYLGGYEIPGRWDRSVWSIHPGNVLYPDYDHLVNMIIKAKLHVEHDLNDFYAQAPGIIDDFDWLKLTETTFNALWERHF